MVKPIPDGYHSITPYLYLSSSAKAIEFYKNAFDAEEVLRLPMPDGSIAHAEVKIGDSIVMMSDENPQWGTKGPTTLGGTSAGFAIYLPDVDKAFAKAIAAGATVMRPVQDQFYGDRSGTVVDPFGHTWTLATHTQDLTPEQMKKNMDEWMKSMS